MFLAKNELSHQRWPFTTIDPLVINGTKSKLCPVENLANYLNIATPKGTGPLFTCKYGNLCSLFKLSKFVCSLILKGDPASKPRVRDIRKMSSSLSFMNNMNIKELLTAMNWKSSSAFYRHYLVALNRPSQDVIIPGGTMMNYEDEEDSDANEYDSDVDQEDE